MAAAPLALVTERPSGVASLQLSRNNVEGLAMALLDLGQQLETALRTVMSMQRSLERVRRCDELSPEGALLLQEMARQVESLGSSQAGLDDRLQAAARRIAAVRCSDSEVT